jgi:hypothetical protein
MYQYSLIDISTIKENLKEYCLDTTIIDSINELTSSLNLQITKPKPYKKEKQIFDDHGKWAKREIFKTTKLEKKEGIDEKLDIFRGILNKMVSNNYEEIKDQLMEILSVILNSNDDNCNHEKVLQCFYLVIVNNSIYSKLYAKLYSTMMEEHVVFEENVSGFIDKYNELFKNIRYVDPDEDYDSYCVINKENIQRKALLKFIVNSVELEIYSFNEILIIITTLFETLHNNLQEKDNIFINEEIIENIFTILQEGKDLITKEVCKYDIIEKIKYYSSLKVSEYEGFSSRMKFKMMDLLDVYK